MTKRLKATKKEFSKIFSTSVCIFCAVIGTYMIIRYYDLVNKAIETGSMVTPDAALPIAGITSIFAPFIGYIIYQAKLKSSANAHGINAATGLPFEGGEVNNE